MKSYKHSHFDEEDEEEELGLESIHKGTKKSSKKKVGPLGVWLLAKGGVSFGNNFNVLKVDGAAGAEAIILGGTLNGNNDGVSGLAVRNEGTAVICNADQIKGATDGKSGVNSGGGGYTLNIAKANISGGDGRCAEPGCGFSSVGGMGLYNDSGGTTTIAGKKVNIIGGIYPVDNHHRARAIYNKGTLVVLEAGAIGDEKTPVSLTNIGGEVDIYGGRDWNKNGKWENDGGTFRVHGKKLDFDSDTKTITGQLCNGYKLHVVVEGDIIFDSNCDAYDDFNGFEECKNYNPYE